MGAFPITAKHFEMYLLRASYNTLVHCTFSYYADADQQCCCLL